MFRDMFFTISAAFVTQILLERALLRLTESMTHIGFFRNMLQEKIKLQMAIHCEKLDFSSGNTWAILDYTTLLAVTSRKSWTEATNS
jgi:hypothetical protein